MTEITEVQKVRDAAWALRYLNLVAAFAALCWVAFGVTIPPAGKESSDGLVHTLAGLVVFATPFVLAFGTYRLARSIDVGMPLLWMLGSFLGCLGILVVLHLCNRGTAWLRSRGLKVGLLGPTRASLAAFEKAMVQTKT